MSIFSNNEIEREKVEARIKKLQGFYLIYMDSNEKIKDHKFAEEFFINSLNSESKKQIRMVVA